MTDQTSQPKIRRKRSPGLKIASPIPVEVRRDDFTKESWLSADDIRCGLDASGKSYRVTDEELGCWANELSDAIARSLEIQRTPIAGDYKHTVKVLAATSRHCKSVVSAILSEMPEVKDNILAQSDENRIQALREALLCTDSPAITGLLSAAVGPSRRNIDAENLLKALTSVDQLRTWADAVKEQFDFQARRARTSKAENGSNKPSSSSEDISSTSKSIVVSRQGVTRQVGKKLLEVFEQATNDLPRLTRDRPTGKSPNKPGGNAIRFLEAMFHITRKKLKHSGMSEVSLRAWNPKIETFAKWITSYQAAKTL